MTSPVVVVVVTYNSENHVAALLNSLPEAFGALPWRTVVVDNGSNDATVAILESRTDCTVVRSQNVGFAAGVNKGVHQLGTQSGPILVLNPDAVLSPGSAAAMVEALATPGVGIVAPLVTEQDGRLSLSLRREPTLARATGLTFTKLGLFSEQLVDERDYARTQVVDWAMGAILLIARPCYDALRGFDESFFLYSEETDFCLRARDLGWSTLFVPSAQAMHIGGGSGESDKTHTMQAINRIRLYRRRNGDSKAWVFYLLTVAREIRWAARGHPFARAALNALLHPTSRPAELNCGSTLLPR
ncbi:glycosyltransferase family 2 protein [Georgenia yuyongxinii]|uniref:glycosyltransferase family 2 protein n=1 Tax=Georgenia yuyongxinii TaxID=2589797 RepID=UPI00163D79C3|nr:glycosyltransferase family 2 protein [Georgenia yuyongxinii]